MSSISGVGGFRPPPQGKPPSFEKLDGDSNGSLSLDEFKSGAPKGADATKSENLFKAIDADSDGAVTKEESDAFKSKAEKAGQQLQSFLFGLQSGQDETSGTDETKPEDDIFAQLDSNADGSIAKDEFLSVISGGKTGSSDKTGSNDLLSKLFDAIDSDKDGSISKTEQSSFKKELEDRGPPPRSSAAFAASQSYGTSAQLGTTSSASATYSRAA